MRHGGMWSDGVYRIHLGSCSAQELERDAADLFVRELSTQNNIALGFDSKPDEVERTDKAPDFVYVDDAADVRVVIEVKQPFRQEYKHRDDLFAKFAKDIEACLQQPVRCLIVCDDDGVASWTPPKRTGKEKRQRDQMCRDIARVLEREAARVGRGVFQMQAQTASSPWIDLTRIMPAEALLLTYTDGQECSVAMVAGPGSGESQSRAADGPAAGPSSSAPGHGLEVAESDDVMRQRRAEYWGDRGIVTEWERDLVMQEIMRKTYQCLLANANAKFGSYRASGYETVFLLDGRLENHLFPYEPETLCRFHQDATDEYPSARALSPLNRKDFDCIQHVVVLGIGWYGVRAAPVWRASNACLAMPASSFLPEGWSADS